MKKELEKMLLNELENSSDKISLLNEIKKLISSHSPQRSNPVDCVLWVPINDVVANDYNPNTVASKEMQLLRLSISEDGYTQPIVTVFDATRNKYVIIDGFHRSLVLKTYSDIAKKCNGLCPIVVLDKNIDQRMASTVRHNRARGTHSVDGMSNIIYNMMSDGKSEKEICKELGMEPREFVKLKYITGFAKVFKNYDYSKSVDASVSFYKLKETFNEKNNE